MDTSTLPPQLTDAEQIAALMNTTKYDKHAVLSAALTVVSSGRSVTTSRAHTIFRGRVKVNPTRYVNAYFFVKKDGTLLVGSRKDAKKAHDVTGSSSYLSLIKQGIGLLGQQVPGINGLVCNVTLAEEIQRG